MSKLIYPKAVKKKHYRVGVFHPVHGKASYYWRTYIMARLCAFLEYYSTAYKVSITITDTRKASDDLH